MVTRVFFLSMVGAGVGFLFDFVDASFPKGSTVTPSKI